MSRASSLHQCINMVWWKRSLPIRLWRVFYSMFSIITTTSWNISSCLCCPSCSLLWINHIYLQVICQILIKIWKAQTYTFISSNFRKIRRHCRRSSVLQTRLKSLSSMDTAVFDEKDFISWQNDNSVRYVEVDRVTTVWPIRRCISMYEEQSRRIVSIKHFIVG